jgi:hypothetical protein
VARGGTVILQEDEWALVQVFMEIAMESQKMLCPIQQSCASTPQTACMLLRRSISGAAVDLAPVSV